MSFKFSNQQQNKYNKKEVKVTYVKVKYNSKIKITINGNLRYSLEHE